MDKLFYGMFFIWLSFSMVLGTCVVELIPGFVGFYCLIRGFKEMEQESSNFQKGIWLMQAMVVFSVVTYVLDLLGITSDFWACSYVIEAISTSVSLYITYICVEGILDMERIYGRVLNGDSLKQYWRMMLLFTVLSYVEGIFWPVSAVASLLNLVLSVFFVIRFHNTKDKYHAIKMPV